MEKSFFRMKKRVFELWWYKKANAFLGSFFEVQGYEKMREGNEYS